MTKEATLYKCKCSECWLREMCSIFGKYCNYFNCSLDSDSE